MAFVGDHDDRPSQILVALGEVVHGIHQADVADGQLRFVAFAGVSGQISQGHIALGPGSPRAIEQFALEALAEQVDGLAHFLSAFATFLR
ncbi:hypothetical protein D9M71_330760 [compost metagenome]